MKIQKVIAGISVLFFFSCGKEFTCECTNVTKLAIGTSIDTTTATAADVDRYKDLNEAKLMCENTKIETVSPTATAVTTCKIK